jgi:hypothetical protein
MLNLADVKSKFVGYIAHRLLLPVGIFLVNISLEFVIIDM